jgi:hypothetical protein
MKNKSKFSFLLLSLIVCSSTFATDLEHSVSGSEVEDSLAKMKTDNTTQPYIMQNSATEDLDRQPISKKSDPDVLFTKNKEDLTIKDESRKRLEDSGYTAPGTFEHQENYIEINKKEMAADFRKHSSGALNLTFIKNNFSYDSQNDIINKTLSGYKHVRGGALYIRSDQYFYRTAYLNSFWSLGAGLGFNSGRGIFVTGDRSDTTFRLWEIPVDAGIGLEIPIYHWFKISGTAGPSATGLYQNRSDFQQGEKGKNKIQVSYGEFANAQFKFNLSGFSDNMAYDLFTESKITNLFLNLEVRYQNYQNFQDEIKISGTSYGIGFTFEYF